MQNFFNPENLRTLFSVIYPSNKITKKSNNVQSRQKFNVFNTELLGTRDVSKKSENGSEPRTEQDGMNDYVETAGEVKDNEVGKPKPENSSGRDEKNKSIEGKEEMEWLDHSEVQSQKHASLGKGLLLCDYQVPRVHLDDKQTERLASYFWVLQVYTM